MKSDIKIMIELQRYWQNILASQVSIERHNKNIVIWQDKIKKAELKSDKTGTEVKTLKQEIKKLELELETADEHIKKLEERRFLLKTEKEVEALENELNRIKEEDGELESNLIALMDDLDSKDTIFKQEEKEAAEMADQFIIDKKLIEEKIAGENQNIEKNQGFYDELQSQLSASVKSRFTKLLTSKNGLAIGVIDGEVCGSCNFQVPSQIALEASKNDQLVTCTNCGRYLYAK